MATRLVLPKLGLTMQEGKIVEWRKKEGEEVKKGDIIYALETEKVTFEVEAPESGFLGKIIAKEGDILPVGGLVGYLVQPGESLVGISEVATPINANTSAIAAEQTPAGESGLDGQSERIKISPLARRIAEENNISPSSIKGTGPGGRITREDVLRAMEEGKSATVPVPTVPTVPVEHAAKEEVEIVPLSPMRKTIAQRMTEGFRVPHFFFLMDVDAGELKQLREKLAPVIEGKTGIKLTLTDLLIKMVARALEDNPEVNSSYADGSVKKFSRIHIGVATSVEGGLIVPVIRDANKRTLMQVCVARAEIVQKTRARKVLPEEITGSTFTITNVGTSGVDVSLSIINPPEAGILSVGAVKDKPVVKDGQVVVRPMITLGLSIDHRVLDGSSGAAFLASLKGYIENPLTMLL